LIGLGRSKASCWCICPLDPQWKYHHY
jgi:hypothetical protein